MKFLKIFFLVALGIFLISNASAMVLYGAWQNNASSITILNNQSVNFTINFGTVNPPAVISASLYNSTNKLVWQKQYNSNNNYLTDKISNISAGNYQLILNGNDAANNQFSNVNNPLYLIVNSNQTNSTNQTDTTAPSIIINSPMNKTYNTSFLTFNITATDASGVAACNYSIDSGNNITLANAGNNIYASTNFSMTEGIHTANFYCTDIYNNLNATKVIFTVDTTAPQIQFTSPTPATNIFVSNPLTINVMASDFGSGLNSVTINVYDFSRNLIDSISSGNVSSSLTVTLPSSTYYINATAYDNAGNSNSTETRIINIQSNNPSNGNSITSAGYTYSDVYQNQYLEQLSRTNQGITLTEQNANTNSSAEFALLLIGIFLVLVLLGIIIFVFAKRKFKD